MRRIMGALAILLLTGCSTPVDGGAVGVAVDVEVTATTAAEPVPWDPCTIPNSAVEAAGLDVATKESGIFGRDQNGFKICSWNDQPPEDSYSLSIFAGLQSLDWMYDSSTYDRLEPTRIGARQALQYQTIGADPTRKCGIAFETEGLLILATFVRNPVVHDVSIDPCLELVRVVLELDGEIPSQP